MANENTGQVAPTIDTSTPTSVAASLLVEDTAPKQQPTPKQVADDPVAPQGATGDDPKAPNAGDANLAGSDEDRGTDAEEDDDNFDPFTTTVPGNEQRSDDDSGQGNDDPDAETFEVKVDGKTVNVTLAELKRQFSGEKAIERRLEEATVARAEAQRLKAEADAAILAERNALIADRNKLAKAIAALRNTLAAPLVKRPDPALRNTDPAQYAAKWADYQADQERVRHRSEMVDNMLASNEALNTEEQTKQLATARTVEATKLYEKVPALRDQKRAPMILKTIADAAAAAGFTQTDIQSAVDHRLYVLALKAGMYDRMKAKATTPKADPVTRGQPNITPGGVGASSGSRAPAAAKRQAALVKQAQETGTPQDVAATLIAAPVRTHRR